MEVKDIFLFCCPLVLSILKFREIRVVWTKKKSGPNKKSPLNSSIDNDVKIKKTPFGRILGNPRGS